MLDIDSIIEYALNKTGSSEPHIPYQGADGIVLFVREVLGVEPAEYQVDILRRFVTRKRIAVRGLHGLGKTALSSWVILWALVAFPDDVKVIATASAWRQLIKYTFPEVHKWARKANWQAVNLQLRDGKELLDLSIRLPGKEAFAVASDNPNLIEGAHASHLVYVFDEAKAIPNATWDAAEGAFSSGDCYALAISTPGEPSGRFYDIHTRKPGFEDWDIRHVTVGEAVNAGRVSAEWIEARKRQWGEKSAVYQNRVLGEFADSEENSVIPLSWVEQSNERWRDCEGRGRPDDRITYGVDPARYGEDQTTTARNVGHVLESLVYHVKQSTMQTAGRIAATVDKDIEIAIDTIGIGAGVYDRLEELKYKVIPVNVSESTELKDSSGQVGFYNLRSAIWWLMREALDPDQEYPAALPPDDILTGDLTAPTWDYTSRGEIKVESKDEIRARIGRSTDAADAYGLALYARRVGIKKMLGMMVSKKIGGKWVTSTISA